MVKFIRFSRPLRCLCPIFYFFEGAIVKIEKLTCPHCGAALKIKPGVRMTRCEYCDSALVIEDDSNADDMDLDGAEEAGYRFEKGRQRARDEQKRVVNLDTTSGMSEDHLIRAAQYDHKTYTNAAPPKRKKKHTLW
jgi:hypothetical protein